MDVVGGPLCKWGRGIERELDLRIVLLEIVSVAHRLLELETQLVIYFDRLELYVFLRCYIELRHLVWCTIVLEATSVIGQSFGSVQGFRRCADKVRVFLTG